MRTTLTIKRLVVVTVFGFILISKPKPQTGVVVVPNCVLIGFSAEHRVDVYDRVVTRRHSLKMKTPL